MKQILVRKGMILVFALLALTAVVPSKACYKEIIDGPESLEIYTYAMWTFEIVVAGPGGTSMRVEDVIPAEFNVLSLSATEGDAYFYKKGKGKGATHIVWEIEEYTTAWHLVRLYVTIETRTNPSGKKVGLTTEGWYPLNEGATATFTYPDDSVYSVTTGGLSVYAYEP